VKTLNNSLEPKIYQITTKTLAFMDQFQQGTKILKQKDRSNTHQLSVPTRGISKNNSIPTKTHLLLAGSQRKETCLPSKVIKTLSRNISVCIITTITTTTICSQLSPIQMYHHSKKLSNQSKEHCWEHFQVPHRRSNKNNNLMWIFQRIKHSQQRRATSPRRAVFTINKLIISRTSSWIILNSSHRYHNTLLLRPPLILIL